MHFSEYISLAVIAITVIFFVLFSKGANFKVQPKEEPVKKKEIKKMSDHLSKQVKWDDKAELIIKNERSLHKDQRKDKSLVEKEDAKYIISPWL
jgi:hypothetical protein